MKAHSSSGRTATWDGEEAWRNLLANPGSRWFAERRSRHWPATAASRLERAVVLPEVRPSFRLDADDKVFTIGSCFARNIENHLMAQGIRVESQFLEIPGFEFQPPHSSVLFNKFTTYSMLNELRWALEPGAAFPEHSLLEEGEDKWIDPQVVGDVAPAPRDTVLARRPYLLEAYRRVRECRVVVLTLGLVEAWRDTQTGMFLNRAPGFWTVKKQKGRFELHTLDYQQNRDALEQIHALLVKHGHPDLRMVVTVSPVPMSETFTGRDVLIANAYSKSTLRAVAEDFVRAHKETDYYPSYESVSLSDRRVAFHDDLHHVSEVIVDVNVRRFIEHYLGSGEASREGAETQRHADERLTQMGGDLLGENARLRAEVSGLRARESALEVERDAALARGLRLAASGRLLDRHGHELPVAAHLEGSAEVGESLEDELLVSGWAIDRESSARSVAIVACVAGQVAGSTVTDMPRPDVAQVLQLDAPTAGFTLALRRPAGALPPVRVFALSGRGARELHYHDSLYRLPR